MKKERFNKAFNHLKGSGIIKTQREAAKIIGIDTGNLSNALKGIDKYLTDSFLEKFNNAFNNIFNIEWLITGDGDMLKDYNLHKHDNVIENYKSLVDNLHKIIREQEIIIESKNKELSALSDTTHDTESQSTSGNNEFILFLREQITGLKGTIDMKDREINNLNQEIGRLKGILDENKIQYRQTGT